MPALYKSVVFRVGLVAIHWQARPPGRSPSAGFNPGAGFVLRLFGLCHVGGQQGLSAARLVTPSFWKTCSIWVSTVRSETNRCWATLAVGVVFGGQAGYAALLGVNASTPLWAGRRGRPPAIRSSSWACAASSLAPAAVGEVEGGAELFPGGGPLAGPASKQALMSPSTTHS